LFKLKDGRNLDKWKYSSTVNEVSLFVSSKGISPKSWARKEGMVWQEKEKSNEKPDVAICGKRT